jgi:hypothetical protein
MKDLIGRPNDSSIMQASTEKYPPPHDWINNNDSQFQHDATCKNLTKAAARKSINWRQIQSLNSGIQTPYRYHTYRHRLKESLYTLLLVTGSHATKLYLVQPTACAVAQPATDCTVPGTAGSGCSAWYSQQSALCLLQP